MSSQEPPPLTDAEYSALLSQALSILKISIDCKAFMELPRAYEKWRLMALPPPWVDPQLANRELAKLELLYRAALSYVPGYR